jgi:hypothetical protein
MLPETLLLNCTDLRPCSFLPVIRLNDNELSKAAIF